MARGFSQAMAREAGLLMPVPPPSKVRDMTVPATEPSGLSAYLDPVALQALREVGPVLAHKGRGGDSLLVHLDPVEAEVLRDAGGSGGINPRTGLREYQDGNGTGTAGDGNTGMGGNGSVGGSVGGGSSSSTSSSPGGGPGGGGYSTSFGFGADMGYTGPESEITGPGMGPQGGGYVSGDYEDGARGRALAETGRYGPMGGIGDRARTPDPANADDWRNEGFTPSTTFLNELVSFLTPVTPGYTYDPETRSIRPDISQTDLAAGLISTLTPFPVGIPFTDLNIPTAINELREWAEVNDVTVEDDYSAGDRTNSQDRDLWNETLKKIGDENRDDRPGGASKLDGSVRDAIDKMFSNLERDRSGGARSEGWTGTALDKGKVDMGNGGFSKQVLGQQLSAFGRNGDTMVAHINPREAALLKAMGGSGTLNPVTGLPEFYAEADVTRAYQSILGRAPDAGGLAAWQAENPNGSYADLTAKISASPEAQARSAVTSAYQTSLGRAPEAPALAAWTNDAMNSPGGIGAVTKGISNSDEAQNRAIQGAYQSYLGRGAESDDVVKNYNAQMDTWLASGLDPYAELGKAFQGSDEARARSNPIAAPVIQPAPAGPKQQPPQNQFDYTGLMKQFQDMMGAQQSAYNDQLKRMQEQYNQRPTAVPDILSATPLQAGLTNSPQLTGTATTGVRKRTPRIDPLTGAISWDEDSPAGFAAYDPNRASRRSGFGSIMRF